MWTVLSLMDYAFSECNSCLCPGLPLGWPRHTQATMESGYRCQSDCHWHWSVITITFPQTEMMCSVSVSPSSAINDCFVKGYIRTLNKKNTTTSMPCLKSRTLNGKVCTTACPSASYEVVVIVKRLRGAAGFITQHMIILFIVSIPLESETHYTPQWLLWLAPRQLRS